ncbi:hypothetical protein RM190_05825 [Paracoccus sp. CPCC 101403]|uniref:DUF1214 domain-containing protein n=1 Tax=Paracoccus broussonetiae TaxID=3075834 RepID=A0ABU3EBW4_9RHOB|nr:hypothetical protein [Paracoccus sp. CPCC 101403]MDT1061372.1 hypothetical protein [Paracoccus sp. CPCC 101403]
MKIVANGLILVVAAVLLGAMMLSNPDYNSAIRPFVAEAEPGEMGRTRLIAGRFDGWRTADRVQFSQYGRKLTRGTGGVFLIADLTLSGTTTSTMVAATWIGASKRQYRATSRVSGPPRLIDQLWLQPGIRNKTFAVFELPPDEIAGGALLLTLPLNPPMEGTLQIAPPETPPGHETLARLDE